MRFQNSAERSLTDRSGGIGLRLVATAFTIVFGASCLATLTGCDRNLPMAPPRVTAPPPPPESSTTSFVGNIMDADTHRVCIENARAEIISGPRSGTIYPQNRDYCEESSSGFEIEDLPVGAVVRLRASAPGYTSVERDFVIVRNWSSIDINLKRAG